MPRSCSTPACPEPVPVGVRCLACARELASRRRELAEVTPPAAQRRRGRPRRTPGAAPEPTAAQDAAAGCAEA